MVKKIKISEIDRKSLLSHVYPQDSSLNNMNFAGVVVNKPWGYEYLLYENKEVAIWLLYIKKGHSTSMHCHPRKKTSLLVLSGEAVSSSLNDSFNLKEKDGLIIDKGVFHKTEAISDNGIFIMEVETPPNKIDLFRLEDKYKREMQAYTRKKNITNKTYNYHYLFIEDKNNSNEIFGKYKFLVRYFKNNEIFSKNIKEIKADLGIILSGRAYLDNNLFDIGDLIEFKKLKKAKIDSPLKLLFIYERKNLIKVSDYIISFLENQGVNNVFLVSGGKIMYLLESIRSKDMNYICNHHEQASAMAAEGYSKLTNKIGFALVTGGSGATNALTGVAGAWIDSAPLLIISGQSYDDQTVGKSGLRQLGVHELNIVDIIRPITKYAIMVKDPIKIKYHLEKAIYLATSGRPGPVWIDIPINIQMAMIEEEELDQFKILNEDKNYNIGLKDKVSNTIELIKNAKRPILLLGNGVRLAKAEKEFLELAEKISIPIATSRNAHDIIWDNHELYIGRPGMFGQRAANFAIQNCDLLLSIGSGVGLSITGWAHRDFAREAKKIIVDIDSSELIKPHIRADISINCCAKDFIAEMLKQLQDYNPPNSNEWKERIKYWKEKYPNVLPEWREQKEYVNPYYFVDLLSEKLAQEEIVVTDSAMSLQCVVQAMKFKRGQRLISSSGLGSIGFGLPGAIGACIANDKKRIICITGDGGLQFNIQELQTISHNNLSIKIFVFNNNGYSLMKGLQKRYFPDKIGVDSSSGLSIPDLEKLALTYRIRFNKINNNKEIAEKINEALNHKGPFICIINMAEEQQVIPRQGSFNRPDGKTVPRPIEDMFPYLDREELEKEMIIDPIYFDPYHD